MKKNYMFCMDIKTMLQHDALPKTGRCYRGTLTMVNDYLCRFVEMVPIRPIRRNPKSSTDDSSPSPSRRTVRCGSTSSLCDFPRSSPPMTMP